MSTSVKLDPESATLLDQLTRSSGRTKQETVRQALRRFSEDETMGTAPYPLIEDLVGIARGGPDDLARRHKMAFRKKSSTK